MENLVSATPTEPPTKAELRYGLEPAIGARPGTLCEADEDGNVTDTWNVRDNLDAIWWLRGKRVCLPPGFPALAQALRERSEVVVWHKNLPAPELAKACWRDPVYL